MTEVFGGGRAEDQIGGVGHVAISTTRKMRANNSSDATILNMYAPT